MYGLISISSHNDAMRHCEMQNMDSWKILLYPIQEETYDYPYSLL